MCAKLLEISDLRWTGENFVLYPIRKIGVSLVFASVFKWKHSDAFFWNDRCQSSRSLRKNEEGSDDCGEQKQCRSDCGRTELGAAFFKSLEFRWKLQVPYLLGAEIHDTKLHAVFHFTGSEIV